MLEDRSSLPPSVAAGWSCNEKDVLNHIVSTHKREPAINWLLTLPKCSNQCCE